MSGRRRLRLRRLSTLLVAGALLSGCASPDYTAAGPFRPLPQGAPPEVGPPPTARAPEPAPGGPSQQGSGRQQAGDSNVVAHGLSVPIGLVVLPDGTAIVGERDTGRLLQVFPDRSPARLRGTIPGLNTSGDGGLLGLALSPTFGEDGLLYAYVSTATDNRVVRLPLGGTPNPVLTGIPHGAVHNGGGLLFGGDGHLLVGTGDTGNPALAADPHSLAGKVLQIDVFGHPAGKTPVFSSGHRNVTALCQGAAGAILAADAVSPAGPDDLDAVARGRNFGAGGTAPTFSAPAAEAGFGGCAVAGSTVFIGALAGKRVDAVHLDGHGGVTGSPVKLLAGTYGRLRSVAVDADGGVWVTTSNRDGVGAPGKDDDKVLRILPPSAQSNSPL